MYALGHKQQPHGLLTVYVDEHRFCRTFKGVGCVDPYHIMLYSTIL